ncbi:MAG: hydrolase [Gemmatimonadota bacterium]|nr:hydrolase [Gemmatimonadota bacterium]
MTAESFEAAWWLPGPHLQTIWGKKARRVAFTHDRLERFAMPDGDSVSLARMGRAAAGTPHLLVLHGLEGSVRATYAHGLLAQARRRGWTGDLLLFRTCDGEMNRAPRMYHSGETTDLDAVARHLVQSRSGEPIFVVGVSLGGNVLLKWLGELGPAGPALVRRAVAVSVPMDLAAGSRYLERGISRLYVRHFLATLKPKALAKARQYPGMIRVDEMLAARTFWEFDDAATAPLHGFHDAADYYARSSSMSYLHRVAVPTLVLGARDDPFVPPASVAQAAKIASESRFIEMQMTQSGGHVGWVSGQPMKPQYYMEKRSIDFLANA